jgi:hypothetical protein
MSDDEENAVRYVVVPAAAGQVASVVGLYAEEGKRPTRARLSINVIRAAIVAWRILWTDAEHDARPPTFAELNFEAVPILAGRWTACEVYRDAWRLLFWRDRRLFI